MYEAVRQRAPNSPQIAGAATAALMTVLAGYALANGFGEQIVRAFDPPVVLATLPEIDETPEPVELAKLDTTTELTMPAPDFIPPNFERDDSAAIIVKEGPKASIAPGPTIVEPRKAVRIAPRLKSREEPPYPAVEVRAGNQGITGLEVCVDARGRVTSASLKQSSGHVRLDEAALKWVRDARFTPGSVDGAAQAMCGHNVFYEWKIENGRT
jgi:periplasmic protein TonB